MRLFIYFSNTTDLVSTEVWNIIVYVVTQSSMDSSVGLVTCSLNHIKIFLTYLFHAAQSSREANWCSASQEIPYILWNPKVHFCIHKCPPLVPILSHLDVVHALTAHFLNIHPNIILPSMPGSSRWSLSRFPHQNPVYTPLLSPIHATCPAYIMLLDLITQIILGEEHRSLSSSLCSFLNSPVTSYLLGPNVLLSTLFSNTLSLSSSFNVSDKVSHPYIKQIKLYTVLYILIFKFLDSKLKDKGFCSEW